MKKDNPRLDLLTRKPFPKAELIRFVVEDNKIRVRESGGRGYYIAKDSDLTSAKARKALSRVLRREANDSDIEALKQ